LFFHVARARTHISGNTLLPRKTKLRQEFFENVRNFSRGRRPR
jgi:hypothetical protein